MAETNGTTNGAVLDIPQTYVGTRTVRPDGVDKVTGRARFGADFNLPGQLVGRVLRSPHPHARIISIDTSKAEALPGVKAVITRDDFADQASELIPAGEMMMNYRDVVRNVMAREKALYEGHAVAAVAATSVAVAKKALKLIDVKYEVLPHVIDVVEAMSPDAPVLHADLFTAGVEPKPEKASNVAKRIEIAIGDIEAGFAKADVIVEREFNTAPVHQGYIEPHAALASVSEDGTAEVWATTQGHFIVRAHCARLLGMDISKIRVTASEIGGGFGGKTVVYLEPLALALSRKAKRPVKMVMSREDVFKASGPTSGANIRVKLGASKDGRFVAGYAELRYQAGAFAGSPVQPGVFCAFAPYDMENVKVIGYDVVSNRPKVAAYRAPGAPISEFAVESVVDEIAKKLDIDPVELRLQNAAREGTKAAYGPKFGPIGLVDTLHAVEKTNHYTTPLEPWQGRGVASGFWFNIGGETCASLTVNEDGTVSLVAGTPDIGGLRASLAAVAADELGVPYEKVRPIIGDTGSIGFNFLTGGSRSCFSGAMAIVEAAKEIKADLCRRAAKLWDLKPEDVEFCERRGAGQGRGGEQAHAHDRRGLREGGGQDRRAHRRHRPHQRAGRGPELRHAPGRRRGRSRDRTRDDPPLHRGAGRGQGDPSQLRRGPVPGRSSPGHRLGAQRGVHLRRGRQAPERGLPRLPHAGGVGSADDRRDPGRGAEPAASLRRARRRRDADRAADGRHRQRDRAGHRRALHRAADVAAQGAQGAPRPRAQHARGAALGQRQERTREERSLSAGARERLTDPAWHGWSWSATSPSSRAGLPSWTCPRPR